MIYTKRTIFFLNVECSVEILDELTTTFRFNDAVLRNMVIKRKDAATEISPIKAAESRQDRDRSEAVVTATPSNQWKVMLKPLKLVVTDDAVEAEEVTEE